MDPRDKIAIVTGGGSGIGRATALRLCAEGAIVVAADRDGQRAGETAQLAVAAGGRCSPAEVDVANPASLEQLFLEVERKHGGLDILHNNAGVLLPPPAWPEAPIEAWGRMLDVNLRAVIHGTQLAIAAMRRRGGGAIVNTASLFGELAFPSTAVYCATKHAVIGLTRSAAFEVARHGIRINALAPGPVNTGLLHGMFGGEEAARNTVTKFVPMKRISEPAEQAQVVLWLCSDAASFIVGHTLRADGGGFEASSIDQA